MPSKRDYVRVARIIRNEREGVAHSTEMDDVDVLPCLALTSRIARELATYFADTNPRFDRAKFLEACGVGDLTSV